MPKLKCFSTGLFRQMFSLISCPNLSSVIALLGSREHQAEAILLKESESIPALGKAKYLTWMPKFK